MASEPVTAPIAIPSPTIKRYSASIHPGPNVEVDDNFASLVTRLESALDIPIWLIVQDGSGAGAFSTINEDLFAGLRKKCGEIETKKPAGLLIDSFGGDAHIAFQIARLFQRRASEFIVIVPRCAKSAATLLALGATELIMGRDAELGPLDVQIYDPEREEVGSALNAIQSLERLNAFSMAAIDQLMPLLLRRTGRKIDTLLPMVLDYVVDFVKPLLDKIDAVDYTKKSRELKVAEQYAIRLMRHKYGWSRASSVARSLVEKFPTHSFVIDREEARAYEKVSENETFGLGLTGIKAGSSDIQNILEELAAVLDGHTVIGRLKEIET